MKRLVETLKTAGLILVAPILLAIFFTALVWTFSRGSWVQKVWDCITFFACFLASILWDLWTITLGRLFRAKKPSMIM